MPPRKKVEVVEEPAEAQPPPGVILDEPSSVGEASDSEMQRLVEAARKAALDDTPNFEEDVEIEAPVVAPSVSVTVGSFVNFVLDRNIIDDLRSKGVGVNALAMGDVAPALVIRSPRW